MFQRFFWLNSVAWFVGQHLIHKVDEELVVSLRVVRFAGWELLLLSCARRDYFGQRLNWILTWDNGLLGLLSRRRLSRLGRFGLSQSPFRGTASIRLAALIMDYLIATSQPFFDP